jgi:hypothetical protein
MGYLQEDVDVYARQFIFEDEVDACFDAMMADAGSDDQDEEIDGEWEDDSDDGETYRYFPTVEELRDYMAWSAILEQRRLAQRIAREEYIEAMELADMYEAIDDMRRF